MGLAWHVRPGSGQFRLGLPAGRAACCRPICSARPEQQRREGGGQGWGPIPTNRRRLPQGAPPPSPEAAAPSLALGPAAAGVHPPSEPWSAAATTWTRCRRGLQPLRRRQAMALPQPACAAVAPQRLCAGGRRRRGRRAPLEGRCAKRRRWLGRVRREAICRWRMSGRRATVPSEYEAIRVYDGVVPPFFFCDSLCEIDYHW